MKEIILPVHSVIDLITNSSTEIFVNSKNSLEPAKELLNELLKIEGSDKTCDDVFDVSLKMDEYNIVTYFEYSCEYEHKELYKELGLATEKDWKKRDKIKKIAKEITDGTREMPEIDNEGAIQTHIVVKCKDAKYEKFIDILIKFLYSPDYYEYSND